MGTDSKLFNKAKNKSIYCDRLYNLHNDYAAAKGLLGYLCNEGLPKYMIVDLCIGLNEITHRSKSATERKTIYEEILQGLEPFEDNDIFVLIDEHDDRYYRCVNDSSNMKVYVLFLVHYDHYRFESFYGVFRSIEKARSGAISEDASFSVRSYKDGEDYDFEKKGETHWHINEVDLE